MKYFILLSCIFVLVYILNEPFVVNSDCNVCNKASKQACISSTEYQQCNSSNLPYGRVFECNEGFYCSKLGGCAEDIAFEDCAYCGVCIPSNTFACKDTKTFELCLDGALSGITGQCNGELSCSVGNPYICGSDPPSCSYQDDPQTTPIPTTSTTPSPESHPAEFCQAMKIEGRFPIGTDPQTTCRQYVHCMNINDVWYGPIYNCPGVKYYNSTSRICVDRLPSTCTNNVSGLSFRNIHLE